MSKPKDRMTKNMLASGGHEWEGKEIFPFTPQRAAIAAEMGMTWPMIRDEDRFETEIEAAGKKVKLFNYRQSFKDSIIVIWLCLQGEVRVDRAERKTDEAMSEAWTWANTVGLKMATEKAGKAYALLIQIISEITESKGAPISQNESNDSGEI